MNFFKTRIHVCHHSLLFSNSVFSWILLLVSPSVHLGANPSPCNSFFHIIYSFGLSVKFFFFVSLYPIVGFSLCILHQLVGRIFFCYFQRSCFICIAWPCLGIFWVSFLSSVSFDLFLPVVCLNLSAVVFFGSFHSIVSLCIFSFFRLLTSCCPSSLISHLGLVFPFSFLGGKYQFYPRLVLLLHKLAGSDQISIIFFLYSLWEGLLLK